MKPIEPFSRSRKMAAHLRLMRYLITRLFAALSLCLLLPQANASSATLLPPDSRWISGQDVILAALVDPEEVPPKLHLQITDARGFVTGLAAALKVIDGGIAQYHTTIPAAVSGRLLVRLESDQRAPYVVEILPAALAATAPPTPTYEDSVDDSQPRAPRPVEFTWVDAFYTHEPLYFVAGATDDSDAKFQVSFKYQLYTPTKGLPKRLADGWLAPTGLYATYTQTSLWDIAGSSSPFRDTSYKPGLYWQQRDVWFRQDESGRARLALMYGVEHESNGRAEPDSRSINVVTFRPSFGYVTRGQWRFLVSPKLYAYLEKSDNPDIARYRGYADLLLVARMPSDIPEGGLQLSLLGRIGSSGHHGNLQADLTYPIRLLGVPGYLAAQLFTGYGEAILDYDQRRETQYRLGFAAIR
jgi:outer membrane phospholipase A